MGVYRVFQIYRTEMMPCADPEGGWGTGGSGPPLENYKNIGFLSNTSPDPLKIAKLPSQYLDPSSPHQTRKNQKKTTTLSKLDLPLTKLSGSANACK